MTIKPIRRPVAWTYYGVWRQTLADRQAPGTWTLTAYTVKARSDKEAQGKVKRKFASCGFTGMALVAVPSGQNPNHPVAAVSPAQPAAISSLS